MDTEFLKFCFIIMKEMDALCNKRKQRQKEIGRSGWKRGREGERKV